ncbi:MAG: hypothetical protein F6K36_24250 [Symploca sp. SIO3C6]|nr:hypothetical protein [Symploca sp. SIO3C6]
MKNLWKKHRDNIAAVCAIVSTVIAISGLGLNQAELPRKSKSDSKVTAQTQIEVRPPVWGLTNQCESNVSPFRKE